MPDVWATTYNLATFTPSSQKDTSSVADNVGFFRLRVEQTCRPRYPFAAFSALRINFLVRREPSMGSIPPPSNSIDMTPEKFES